MWLRHLACLTAVAVPSLSGAQTPSHTDDARLETVTVTGSRLERDLADVPGAVTVVDAERIQQGQPGLQLDESLARVPGLRLENRYNFAQNLRLSSRGFGARAPFGVRGLRINVDGFPETLPDGQSQVDAIDPATLESVNVLRGPSSVPYGNATGGAVDITTRSGRDLDFDQSLSVTGGGDGLRKSTLQVGGAEGANHHYLSLTGLRYDGYRDQSQVEKYQLNTRFGRALSPDRDVEVFFNAVEIPTAEDPGGLTRAEARQDRRQAARFSTLLDTGQEVSQQRLGLLYKDRSLGGEVRARTFVTQRDFQQQLPYPGDSLIDYQRLFYGARLEYANSLRWLGTDHRYLVGLDADRQQDDRERRSVAASGQVTGLTAAEDQRATSSGVFAQTDTDLGEDWVLSLGARADRLRLDIEDGFFADGDDSGEQTFTEQSYSAGLTWHVHPRHSLYATVSNAFESPTFTELANPNGGGFNPALEPQKAVNREVGSRGRLTDSTFYDLALFSVRVRDEITPYELGGRTFYENAARTRREGAELMVEQLIGEQFTVTLAWTWSNYQFQEFYDQQQNTDVSGNRLPGLPRHQVFAELDWRSPTGWFAVLEGRYDSAVYAENTNQTRVGGHTLVNTRLGRAWALNERELTLYAGVNNLTDKDYFSNLRINANSDRPDPADRGYFEPGPERTFYAGASYAW